MINIFEPILGIMAMTLAVCLLGGLIYLYFLPYIIANNKDHPYTTEILLINLFLGWTFAGWWCVFFWALFEK